LNAPPWGCLTNRIIVDRRFAQPCRAPHITASVREVLRVDEIERLRKRIARWRTMAARITDPRAIEALNDLVRRDEVEVAWLQAKGSAKGGAAET
jgi:hypothetical protein